MWLPTWIRYHGLVSPCPSLVSTTIPPETKKLEGWERKAHQLGIPGLVEQHADRVSYNPLLYPPPPSPSQQKKETQVPKLKGKIELEWK